MLKSQAVRLKGRLYTLTVLQLLTTDELELAQKISEMVEKAPKLLSGSPIVIDCSAITEPLNLEMVLRTLKQFDLMPVAFQGGDEATVMQALSLGLPNINASSQHDKNLDTPQAVEKKVVVPAKIITQPVRSGQQFVSIGSDLIVTAPVGHGAELMADGNIHVYGALRGRALAGMSGNTEARIFCHSMEAELISIAGYYRLSDAIPTINGPCQVYLKDEQIHIEPIC